MSPAHLEICPLALTQIRVSLRQHIVCATLGLDQHDSDCAFLKLAFDFESSHIQFLMASLRLTVTSWILLAATVSAAPQGLDPNMIIFPDEINTIRDRLALEQCRRDPNCAAPQNPDFNLSCSSGSGGAENMLRNVINLRSGVGTCNSMIGEVRWPATGECVKLLTQGPCPPGQWVKLTLSTCKYFTPVR